MGRRPSPCCEVVMTPRSYSCELSSRVLVLVTIQIESQGIPFFSLSLSEFERLYRWESSSEAALHAEFRRLLADR